MVKTESDTRACSFIALDKSVSNQLVPLAKLLARFVICHIKYRKVDLVKCFKHHINGKIMQQNEFWTSVGSYNSTISKIMHVWPRN